MTLDEAITEFGTVDKIADDLEISVQAVYKWKKRVPALRIYQLREIKAVRQAGMQEKAAA